LINKFLDKFKDQLNYNFFEIIYDIKHDLDIIILYIIIYKAKNLIIIKFNDIYEKVYIFLLEYCWNIEWVNFNNKVFIKYIIESKFYWIFIDYDINFLLILIILLKDSRNNINEIKLKLWRNWWNINFKDIIIVMNIIILKKYIK